MATLNTIKKAALPINRTGLYSGKIVGSYTDDATRVIDITIEKTGSYLPLIPNQPVSWANMSSDLGIIPVGVTKVVKGSVAGQLVVTVDRGYAQEDAGEAQPVTYPIPATDGVLGVVSPASQAMEAQAWCQAVQVFIFGSAVGDGILADAGDAFAVVELAEPGLGVIVSSGLAATEDGLLTQEAEEVLLVPEFETANYLMKAIIYITPADGAIVVEYGEEHVDTPVAPSYPADVIELATITIDHADDIVETADIADDRVLA